MNYTFQAWYYDFSLQKVVKLDITVHKFKAVPEERIFAYAMETAYKYALKNSLEFFAVKFVGRE